MQKISHPYRTFRVSFISEINAMPWLMRVGEIREWEKLALISNRVNWNIFDFY